MLTVVLMNHGGLLMPYSIDDKERYLRWMDDMINEYGLKIKRVEL